MIPKVFDLQTLRRNMKRAQASGYASFLIERATEDLLDRLSPIMRTFAQVLDIGTPTPHTCDELRQAQISQNITRLPLVPESDTIFLADEERQLPDSFNNYDLAFSLLALQAVNDLPGTLTQIRRLLKPDGLFIACLLGGDTLSELRQSFLQAESELESGISPHVAPFADIKSLGNLMQRAGFALPVIDSEPLHVRYTNVFSLMADLRAMGMTNALVNRIKKPLKRTTLMRMAEIYQTQYLEDNGKIRATFEFIWVLGWAPDESQQKPLRPGQFSVDFRDAIKAANKKDPN